MLILKILSSDMLQGASGVVFYSYILCCVMFQVYETAQEPIPEEKDSINSMHSLSQEATFINQNFSQQVLQKVCFLLILSALL